MLQRKHEKKMETMFDFVLVGVRLSPLILDFGKFIWSFTSRNSEIYLIVYSAGQKVEQNNSVRRGQEGKNCSKTLLLSVIKLNNNYGVALIWKTK